MKTRIVASILIGTQLLGAPALALERGSGLDLGMEGEKEAALTPALTSEFVYRNRTEEALIPVYLLGAVTKPGLYHIPANMDLVGLLTLAGGPAAGAQTDKILIKGQNPAMGKRQIRFDLDDTVQSSGSTKVPLVSNDLVYVAPGKPPISGEILTGIGIVAGILGIVASSIVISQNIHKN